MRDRFRPEHYHSEDEVRFVVAGHGVFGIHRESPEAVFEVHVGPGDLLKVSQGAWHWFDLAMRARLRTDVEPGVDGPPKKVFPCEPPV